MNKKLKETLDHLKSSFIGSFIVIFVYLFLILYVVLSVLIPCYIVYTILEFFSIPIWMNYICVIYVMFDSILKLLSSDKK